MKRKVCLLVFALLTAWSPVAISVQDAPLRPFFPEETKKTAEGRAWTAPDYSKQETGVVGYEGKPFEVPKGFEDRVAFWVRVFSEISTKQGFIHDAERLDRVYAIIDFSDLAERTDLSPRQITKLRSDRIKETKTQISQRLAHLSRGELPDDDDWSKRLRKFFPENTPALEILQAGRMDRLRFQLGQRDRFIEGIFHSGRYLDEMEKIFKEENLPLELTRMPFVESSFNIYAQSKVGASGIWQIMPRTGKLLKLKVNSQVDERNDPWRATRAAAKLLKINYDALGTWPLAVTAYNHGAYGIKRVAQSAGSTDIVEIVRNGKGRRFGFASSNFFASFLAALEVEKNANKYFGAVVRSHPLDLHEMSAPTPMDWTQVVQWFRGDDEAAKLFNPHLSFRVRRRYVKIPQGTLVRVPSAQARTVSSWSETAPAVKHEAEKEKTYRVHRGDTLSGIARRFNVPVQDLMEMNQLASPLQLRIGQSLVIP